MARSDYYKKVELLNILSALMPANRLIMEVCLATGLRVGDVLALQSARLKQRMTIKEQKTGKRRKVYIPSDLLERMTATKGRYYVFEGRLSAKQARTRQAVWKDLKRTAKLFRVDKSLNISPHTTRKAWAVERLRKLGGNVLELQEEMNHDSIEVTLLYAMSDVLNRKTRGARK